MAEDADHPAAPRRFLTTRWSVVLAAGAEHSLSAGTKAREALAVLCQTYWYPLYAYVRRRGYDPDEARDLTQSFFVFLLERNALGAADPQRGRFRSFLLTALKNFLANEWNRAAAEKRGGGLMVLPLSADFDSAERLYGREPADTLTPERLFERRWALTLLDVVLSDLQAQYTAGGRAKLFEHLKPCLTGDSHAPPQARIAAELRITEGAAQVAIHRLRKRYRQLLRAHIEQTVESADQVEDEIRELYRAVRS
jgi:RNA polymerase sigma-70 factor (ECF subfamily)